jgi:hypothetical protein
VSVHSSEWGRRANTNPLGVFFHFPNHVSQPNVRTAAHPPAQPRTHIPQHPPAHTTGLPTSTEARRNFSRRRGGSVVTGVCPKSSRGGQHGGRRQKAHPPQEIQKKHGQDGWAVVGMPPPPHTHSLQAPLHPPPWSTGPSPPRASWTFGSAACTGRPNGP